MGQADVTYTTLLHILRSLDGSGPERTQAMSVPIVTVKQVVFVAGPRHV